MRSHTLPRCFALTLLLLGLVGQVPDAAAQTALLDIKANGSTPVFHVNDDGGLVSLGAVGTGVIPVTGLGARMMWYPAKAAFRAGWVNGTQWDEANVGDYSVAMGQNTRASGNRATALGDGTRASGNWSTALGASTTANGEYATAMGNSTTASGAYALATGQFSTASGYNATAMGAATEASGFVSTALGAYTTASGYAATALGDSTTASGRYATALGYFTLASGENATALGFITAATGDYATTMGWNTGASGFAATAMGIETGAQASGSLVLGRWNLIAGNPDDWISTDPILVVGNGTNPDNGRSNAFTLLKNGNLTIAGNLTQNSDRRLKTDIRPLANACSALRHLQPVRFRFREGTNHPAGEHIGLIAQEVAAVFPALVHEGADGYLSVSYTNLTAVLVQALNEQKTEMEALQDRLARLEALLASGGIERALDRR